MSTTQYTLPDGRVLNLNPVDEALVDDLKMKVMDLLHKQTDVNYECMEIVASEVFNDFEDHSAKCINCDKDISEYWNDLGGTVCNGGCWIQNDCQHKRGLSPSGHCKECAKFIGRDKPTFFKLAEDQG